MSHFIGPKQRAGLNHPCLFVSGEKVENKTVDKQTIFQLYFSTEQ